MREYGKGEPELGMLLNTKEEREYNGSDSNTIWLTFVDVYPDGTIRNASDRPLVDLQVRARQSTDFEDLAYAWKVEYRDVYAVDVDCAQNMVKTLEKLDRSMEKIRGIRGYASTFSDYVARVAEVMRVRKIVWMVGQNRGWSYDDSEHRITAVGEGIDHISYVIASWKQAHPYHNRYAQLA